MKLGEYMHSIVAVSCPGGRGRIFKHREGSALIAFFAAGTGLDPRHPVILGVASFRSRG